MVGFSDIYATDVFVLFYSSSFLALHLLLVIVDQWWNRDLVQQFIFLRTLIYRSSPVKLIYKVLFVFDVYSFFYIVFFYFTFFTLMSVFKKCLYSRYN